jgi:hypothetical protein
LRRHYPWSRSSLTNPAISGWNRVEGTGSPPLSTDTWNPKSRSSGKFSARRFRIRLEDHPSSKVHCFPILPLLTFVIDPAYLPPPLSYFPLATISSRCFVVDIQRPKTCNSVLVSRLDPFNRLRQYQREDRVGQEVQGRTEHRSGALLSLRSELRIGGQE